MNDDITTQILGLIDENGYEKTNRVFGWGGVSSACEARDYKSQKLIMVIEDE